MAERFIGVDIGGTKVAVAVLEDGVLSDRTLHHTDCGSTRGLLDSLAEAITTAADGDTSARVGVGTAGVIDFRAGRVRFSANIDALEDVPLRDELSQRTGLPVVVDNDASVAALAEACDDGGELVVSSLVMVTVGTGIGGGVILDGRIMRGATGAATEFGHTILDAHFDPGAQAPDARFPQPGSFERAASGRALDRLAAGAGFADGPAVVTAAHAGDESAIGLIRILGERLGVGIASLINIFDPHEVVVGGGVSAAGDLLLTPAIDTTWKFVLPGVGTETRIRLARHGNGAGVLGAALLARHELKPNPVSPTH